MKLSPTEQSILSTLEQANGEVVSRKKLHWPVGKCSETSLQVLICRLRKKGFSIKNQKGIGYKLVTP